MGASDANQNEGDEHSNGEKRAAACSAGRKRRQQNDAPDNDFRRAAKLAL